MGLEPQSQFSFCLQKKTEDLKSMGKTPNVILPDRLRFTYVTFVGLCTQLGMHNCKPMVCGLAYFWILFFPFFLFSKLCQKHRALSERTGREGPCWRGTAQSCWWLGEGCRCNQADGRRRMIPVTNPQPTEIHQSPLLISQGLAKGGERKRVSESERLIEKEQEDDVRQYKWHI